MNERTITIKGTGSVSVKPDLITITMNLQNSDATYGGTMESAAASVVALREALAAIGYDKDDLKTTDFNVNADYESYSDDKGNWKQKFIGYKCRHNLELEFDLNMKRLDETLSAVSSCCAEPEINISFTIKDKNAVSEKLLQNAVRNATEKAEVLAAAAGLSLGKILKIDYNWGELSLIAETRMARPLYCASKNTKAVDIAPRNIEVNDSVTVVWEIN